MQGIDVKRKASGSYDSFACGSDNRLFRNVSPHAIRPIREGQLTGYPYAEAFVKSFIQSCSGSCQDQAEA
jgi:actin-like ATPase involved in cell morphogenesis